MKYRKFTSGRQTIVNILTFVFLSIIGLYSAHAQNTITIPHGMTPAFDGMISSSEWNDADSIFLNTSAGDCKIYIKHDCDNLNIAFCGPLESANVFFPEVLIDINNDKSSVWQMEDWWFHVSATDCSFQGDYEIYNNCLLVQPDWIGIPNISAGPPSTDTIEIQLPFSTLGIASTADTIGLAFDLTNTATVWNFWPSTAAINSPATWGSAVFSGCTTGISETSESDVQFYPNPVKEILNISFISSQFRTIEIYTSTGKLLRKVQTVNEVNKINFSDFESGLYLVKIAGMNSSIIKTYKISKAE